MRQSVRATLVFEFSVKEQWKLQQSFYSNQTCILKRAFGTAVWKRAAGHLFPGTRPPLNGRHLGQWLIHPDPLLRSQHELNSVHETWLLEQPQKVTQSAL